MTNDVKTFGPFCFDGPVSQERPNPAAHGCVCYRDERGDERRFRNVNGAHTEFGNWHANPHHEGGRL